MHSDRIASHQLFVHVNDGIVTIFSSLLDQPRYQRQPRLDPVGVQVLLSFGYTHQDRSLLQDTVTVVLGRVRTCTRGGVQVHRYHAPVREHVDDVAGAEEATEAIEHALRKTFAMYLSSGRKPLVLLSGGIDSLVMLRYLSKLSLEAIDTLTFALEGQARHELAESSLATVHFGSSHTELLIRRDDLERLTRRALLDCDYPGYGAFQGVAVADHVLSAGQEVDVYHGQDTRLHTPALDLPTRLGLRLHVKDARLARGLASPARAGLRAWPLQRGRNYFQYVKQRLTPRGMPAATHSKPAPLRGGRRSGRAGRGRAPGQGPVDDRP